MEPVETRNPEPGSTGVVRLSAGRGGRRRALGNDWPRSGLGPVRREWPARTTAVRLRALFRRQLLLRAIDGDDRGLGCHPGVAPQESDLQCRGETMADLLGGGERGFIAAGFWTLCAVLPVGL